MKIGIYNPYMSILGGAERYIFSIAKCLEPRGEIILYDCDQFLVDKAAEKFDIKLTNYSTKPWPKNKIKRLKETSKLHYFFYITDGSIFNTLAKNNFLIIQSPAHIPKLTVKSRIKLLSWKKIIVYSNFVRDIVQKKLNKKANVLFVPIQKSDNINLKKENIIISVGRFFSHLHNKKQLEMVGIFKELIESGLVNTQLYLVGSVDPGGEEYLTKVKAAAKNYPVNIENNLTYSQLSNLYQKSKIYWHAAGYNEDIQLHPENAEHFGVVILEAMSFGVIPIVYEAGGPKELVNSGINGFTWLSKKDLLSHTQNIIKNQELRERMAAEAISFSLQFTGDKFCQKLYEVVSK